MTEHFESALRAALQAHRLRHPALQPEDAVKLVFQAMLGVGHLLGDRKTVALRVAEEMRGLTPSPEAPLLEAVGPQWCRLDLRAALAQGLSADTVAGLMLFSGDAPAYTRQDVLDACVRLLAIDPTAPALSRINDEGWLPSHSPAYRAAERPAYRLISADWAPYMEAVRRIAALRGAPRALVTLDGPCAGGKTTLARRLAEVFGAKVLHTDDFVVPHAQKTAERLAMPGGNCDWERLDAETLAPWKAGKPALCRRYDCKEDRLLPPEALPEGGPLILEGCYCGLPALRRHADLRLFLDTPKELREERLRARESPASLKRFFELWIPLEDAYFAAYQLPDPGCVVVRPE